MGDGNSPQEIHRAKAHDFVDACAGEYGVEIGYDRTGAQFLDKFIASRSPTLDPRMLSDLTKLVGSYLAECIIHEYQAEWVVPGEGELIRIADSGTIDPFWMVRSCLEYRSTYAVSALFDAVPAMARIRIGGLYVSLKEGGAYRIYKVLAVDHIAVHLRKYRNRFEECPSHVDATTLSIDLDLGALTAEMAGELPIGHLPLAHKGFWEMKPVLIQVEPVSEDELDGFRVWLGGTPGLEAEKTQPVRQQWSNKKLWQFWK